MRIHQIIFSLLLILLPTQLGFHFWPDWAMVLGRRVDYLSPTIYLTDILIVFLLASWLLKKNHEARSLKQGKDILGFFMIHNSLFIIFVVLFVALNIFFAVSREVAIYKWLKVLEYSLLGFYILKTKPDIIRSVFFLSLGVCYSAVIAILQFVTQHSLGGLFYWLGERTFSVDTTGIARSGIGGVDYLRVYATFPHPNVLGGFLALLLPFTLYMVLNPNVLMKSLFSHTNKNFTCTALRVFEIVTCALGGIALLLTFSRSALVVCIIGIGFIFARSQKSKLVFPIVIITLGVILLYLKNSVHFGEESLVVRLQLADTASRLWQTSPLVGVGLGNFLVVLPSALISKSIYFLQPVHNIYLLLFSEVGMVGFGSCIFLLLRLLMHGLRIVNQGKIKVIHSLLLAACGMLLIFGLFDHWPITLQQGQLLFVLFFAFLSLSLVQKTNDI